ncbi:MbtH family protein [Streptosporangium algeriense]|uniref:MbtH family protein n=1 Tax=Streptosporangium algeriense TaxID=1682748 RepID=A0ABW3DK09_9ACTN
MSDHDAESTMPYRVVVNDEEQYSIWPEGREVPGGWRVVREAAPKDECLAYIEEVWTDMRPLSLRRRMASDPSTERTAASGQNV